MRELPEAYLRRMQALLGEEYEAFLASYQEPPKKGLRFNRKKARPETIAQLKEQWHLKPVPWCESGFYYEEEGAFGVRPGKSPYHDAGVFYIQEPSAMIPAERADIRANHWVLDLCAAPGGKSTQAAEGAGLLISNEFIGKRAQILSSNIERMGFSNVIVTSAAPEALAEVFPEAFDRIIVDAPCSGEGMMRRDEIAVSEWSEANVALCVERQKQILEEAVKMLRPGGKLVYSTCTFEPGENGLQARALLERHPELRMLSEEQLLPHRAEGEGHFCAVFEKETEEGQPGGALKGLQQDDFSLEKAFSQAAERLRRGRIRILRKGLEPGAWIVGKHKGEKRYEPSHAEAMAMGAEDLEHFSLNLFSQEDALRYLKGEALQLSGLSGPFALLGQEQAERGGFLPVCYDGYPLGFGKLVKGTVKNHYPKGLRRLS